MTSDQQYIHDRVAVMPDGCWIWLKSLVNKEGHGQMRRNGKKWLAHRFAYTAFRGEIPEGLVLDHVVCDQAMCCNPSHLKAVTDLENLRRSSKWNGNKTHCKQGHEFTPENTYIYPNGKRRCCECNRVWLRAYRRRATTNACASAA